MLNSILNPQKANLISYSLEDNNFYFFTPTLGTEVNIFL
jgi:hypothetical protein